MPTLASVQIPVYSRSPSTVTSSSSKGKPPVKPLPVQRSYGDEPLPVKPSEDAAADARIVGRVLGDHGGFYSLKIGDVELNNVGVVEILDYVSAEHLEAYENQQFAEEAELLRIAQIEDERRESAKAERRKERAKLKGVAEYHDRDRVGDWQAVAAEITMGKHGRARPTYKHLFKKPLERRRRRKRDPITGELMPLSDDDKGVEVLQSSEDEDSAPVASAIGTMQAFTELPKRRRRKRDPATGELLPLKPQRGQVIGEQKKRRRRKRHPMTGELMPYGWRYEPNGPSMRQIGSTSGIEAGNMSPAMKRLSIVREHEAKRVKLDSQPSSGTSSSAQVIMPSSAPAVSSDEESSSQDELSSQREAVASKTTPRQVPSASRGKLALPAMFQSTATSSAPESSPEPNNTTSIMQPMAGSAGRGTRDDESDEPGEGEWVIEAILAHHMSDPKTHPRELGNKAVMLYQVKWEGFDELTWEPIDSFSDRIVVEDYQRRAMACKTARAGDSKDKNMRANVSRHITPSVSTQAGLQQTARPDDKGKADTDEDDGSEADSLEDGSYVVEAIMAHHVSDPRTHAPEYGKEPVMLYKVKWKGYEGFTWEPIDSFEDGGVVLRYREKVGLSPLD